MIKPRSSAAAHLQWSLDVECPICKESVDIAQHDDEHDITTSIFNNQWGALIDYDFTCPECGEEFLISGVVY